MMHKMANERTMLCLGMAAKCSIEKQVTHVADLEKIIVQPSATSSLSCGASVSRDRTI